jgi:hypothetical protein
MYSLEVLSTHSGYPYKVTICYLDISLKDPHSKFIHHLPFEKHEAFEPNDISEAGMKSHTRPQFPHAFRNHVTFNRG